MSAVIDAEGDIILLLTSERSSDKETSGSWWQSWEMISSIFSCSLRVGVTLLVALFKGGGSLFLGKVGASCSETEVEGGIELCWGDIRWLSLNFQSWPITRNDNSVPGWSFPPSKPVASAMVDTNIVQFQN